MFPIEEYTQPRFARLCDEASLNDEVLGEGQFSANYGVGPHIDIEAFLRESRRAKTVLLSLDTVERFVLLSYFILRKTEKQLAELVGLNECRFNQFLENLIRKVGALVAFGSGDDPCVWAPVLERDGYDRITARRVTVQKLTRALPETVFVKTTDLMWLFIRTRSFLSCGEHFLAYYVDLRRGLEDVAENLKRKDSFASISLGEYIGAHIQFSGVKQAGYAGRMGKLPAVIKVHDSEALGMMTVRIDNEEIHEVFYPRSLAATKRFGKGA